MARRPQPWPGTTTAPDGDHADPLTHDDTKGAFWTPIRRAIAEFAAGGLTLAAWVGAEMTGTKVWVFLVLLTLWFSYFLARALRHPPLWRQWGILTNNWRRALRWHAGAAVLALTVVGAIGALRATFALPTAWWAILLLYPPWAWFQQFLLQNAVVANAATVGVPRHWLPVVGMVVFGAAHLPDWPMAGLTAMGGLLWTWLWLRAPNLWLLALGHTIVGTTAFLWVLDRNPLHEFPQVARWLGIA